MGVGQTDGGVTLGTGPSAYLRLLRHGPAARPFFAALVARLPIAMAPLGILLLIERERGAYSLAGFVTGAFAVGSAIGMPLWGRLMDRHGQPRVLVPTSLTSAAMLVAVAVATLGDAPSAALLVLSFLAGLAFPPMSPAIRAAWRTIFPARASRRVAFALDGTSVELVFVGGPLLLSLLLVLTPGGVPLVLTAVLLAGGTLAYCLTSAARRSSGLSGEDPEPVTSPRRRVPVVFIGGVATVLATMLILSIGFGQLDTSMAATAGIMLGSTDNVGILFACIAGGSTLGGLAYGARHWRFSERHAVPVLFAAFSVLLGLMALLLSWSGASLALVLPLLFVTGVTIAPALIMQQQLMDHLAPPDRLNEAQSFLSAANTTGAAAGTAVAGVLIDFHGVDWSFAGASAALALAVVVALASQRRWKRAEQEVVAATLPADVRV
ncbi:MFS transporter [Desertihabitans brevis]|uniref:MFS transporter n=1 Tax=Desertihabitans brevis TaxID=2268447 RepID=A0A367YQC8_9ACTN|nr:MFS transporter [Desertihabitans brevis]